MKRTSWLCWFFVFSVIYSSEAQYKFRRLQLPSPSLSRPPPQIFKKSWTPGSRISSMGNSIHIAGNLPHKRPPLIPTNYRFRRPPGPPLPPPPPMYNVLSNVYKNPIPPVLGKIDTYGGMVQRVSPVNELQSIVKDPQQYNSQYQLKIESLSPNIDSFDDDKGPIHTIPAPNLGPASASYQQQQQQQQQYQQQALFNSQGTKKDEIVRKPYAVAQIDYTGAFGDHGSSEISQRIVSTNNNQHQYEVTESNEVNNAVPPFYFTPEFNSAQYSSSDIEQQQTGENNVYLNHSPTPTSSLTNSHSSSIEPSTSMQTNLHRSMHVGVSGPGTAISQPTYTSDLHEDFTNPDEPSIPTAKLYELLNSFPRQLRDHYTSDQQPEIQHLPQHQNKQSDAVKPIFSQPTFHSFSFDEQANKQQQQQQKNIFINQNYALGKVTADYSLAPDTFNGADTSEHQDNNIEFQNPATQLSPALHFNKIKDHQNIAAQFYTTLPNQETAEKLAALAAAGIVNSQLINQLKNQQQRQHESQKLGQQSAIGQSIPANHKEEHVGNDVAAGVNRSTKYSEQHQQEEHQKKLLHRQYKIKEEQTRIEEENEKYRQQNNEETKRPLRIFVPEDNTEKEKDLTADYEYENDEVEVPRHKESSIEDSEYGTRIVSKTGK
ncbi:PREDICTED: putative uncharacterized protein DDB_G0271606 [Ceratosolen solmsi marchali]|uniref:Uncharacterized protein n=1 Tax=Ceratosolen solmsi marchali TaxID=326594 RepID=A0AAJ7E2I8_9HYME|nr:PREDICTED: putative uncharacterized protein DDB_G0271606 [Ceratosolen solmsi marchali]